MRFIWTITALLYIMLGVLEIITFSAWIQVEYLWELGVNPLITLFSHHGPRYMLMWPLFTFAEYLDIHYNHMMSIVVPTLFTMASVLIAKSAHALTLGGKSPSSVRVSVFSEDKVRYFALLFLIFLSMFMSGRISFAIFGASILLYVFSHWLTMGIIRTLFLIVLGVFFASVSSGTIMVAFGFSLLFVGLKVFSSQRRGKSIFVASFFLLILLALSPLLLIMINTNLNFYGGGLQGFIKMFSHGAGGYLGYIEPITLFQQFFIVAVAFLISNYLVFNNKILRLPTYMLFVSILGGVFGYSTAMVGIPAFILLLYSLVDVRFRIAA